MCTAQSYVVWFLLRCIECRLDLAMRILSVRLSVERVICDKTEESCARILIPHECIYPSFVTRIMVGGGDPFYLKFWVK